MADLEIVRKRLEKKILSSGHTFREVSLKIGRKDSYIQQYVKYGFPKRLSEVDRKKVCQLLGMNEKDLVDDELVESGLSRPKLIEDMAEKAPAHTEFNAIDIYAPRPETELQKCIVGRMALKVKEFPEWCGAHPYNLKIIRITTDSMAPTFTPGSLLIYNMDVREYQGEGVYLVKNNGYVQTKRMQKIAATTYLLKSDNQHYEDVSCPESELEILGKAISCVSARLI